MRRLLIAVVVLVAVLVVLDRVAVKAADDVVAARIQAQEHLQSQPSVSIGGFPFLTQAIGGKYDDVTLTVHHFDRSVVPVDTISVELRGVHVPLGAVFSQHLSSVPVDSATARVLLSYGDLNGYLRGKGVSVASAGGDRVRISGSVTVAGQTLSASGTATIEVQSDSLLLRAANSVSVAVPLAGLPFGISLRSATATNRGIQVTATAQELVLQPR
ncbi:MAG: DUF2993 domain-containing protein [Frankiaceae bacterium]|nr:DUF2993 domain-containing protein [Frankiaceae bacterium]